MNLPMSQVPLACDEVWEGEMSYFIYFSKYSLCRQLLCYHDGSVWEVLGVVHNS